MNLNLHSPVDKNTGIISFALKLNRASFLLAREQISPPSGDR